MKISRSDALLDKEFHGKRALVDKELIFFLVEWKLSTFTWQPAVFSSDMRKDTWVVQLWSIVFNLAIFFWLFVQVPQNLVKQASKKEEVEKLSSCGQDAAHIIFLKRCEESSTSPLKNTFWSYGSHSQRIKSSQLPIFKSFLEPQRPNPTEMCDLRYAYTSHVQKSFLAQTFAFLVDKFQALFWTCPFCSNSKCPQFHPWVEVSPCWYIN